jgi:quinol monooxygenase YgiN
MAPIVFISHSRVRVGNVDDLRGFLEAGAAALQAEKPRTLAFLPYLSEDESELAIVHEFADADAFDVHLEGVAERSKAAGEFIETLGFEIYGRPSQPALDMMRMSAARSGATLELHPEGLVGFLRAG